MPKTIRFRCTSDAQPLQPRDASSKLVSPRARAARWRRVSSRLPSRPLSAGSSVKAPITGNATAIAAPIAAPDRVLTPTVRTPSRAMHTVMPAKSTARPAVPAAVVTASSTLRPRRSPVRVRVRMNRE
jgi:hypothetical protein